MREYSEFKHMLFIVNPVSGKKLALRQLPELIKYFTDSGYLVTTMVTSRKGDAVTFAKDYGGDYDLVVCIGGDGTLCEVVTGLAKGEISVDCGYIPAGSTNDFAACHELSSDIMTAAENIVNGSVTCVDLGKFGEHYFSYVAAFGAFSWLSYSTPQNLKNVFGHSAYIIDAVKDISKIKSEWMSFFADGQTYEGNFIFGAVCSSTSVAGLFELPKDVVDTSDGKFEVLLIHEPPTLIECQNIVHSMLAQDYASNPYIEFFQASRISIESKRKHTDWSLDGEHAVAGQLMEVENIKQFIHLKS